MDNLWIIYGSVNVAVTRAEREASAAPAPEFRWLLPSLVLEQVWVPATPWFPPSASLRPRVWETPVLLVYKTSIPKIAISCIIDIIGWYLGNLLHSSSLQP